MDTNKLIFHPNQIETMTEKELKALKLWLFSEMSRLENEKQNIQEMKFRVNKERMQFQKEMTMLNQQISSSQQRLKQDEMFFDKKMQILQNAFMQLDLDRKEFERKKAEFEKEAKRKKTEEEYNDYSSVDVGVFFAGVKNPLALKKRYKDLMKIFHPDNLAGDKDIVQQINIEYERLKKMF